MESYLEPYYDQNHINFKTASLVPEECKISDCILGIDEAGRGPVLGPLVYGCCYFPKKKSEEFNKLGCADSKTLTEADRIKLFGILNNQNHYVGWRIDVISPSVICESMYKRSKYSLNEVSHDSAISLIRDALESGVKLKEVFVDTVGMPDKYQKKLSALFPDLEITVAKKADSLYPAVSGASICAKVARDTALCNWKLKEKLEVDTTSWGSGYPNDPLTKKFLSNNVDPVFGFPRLVRFSWSTSEKILQTQGVEVTWDEEEEVDTAKQTKTSILKFFAHSTDKKKESSSHQFFKNRYLTSATEF